VLIFLFAAGRMSNPSAGRWCPQVPSSVLLLYGAIVSSWSSGPGGRAIVSSWSSGPGGRAIGQAWNCVLV
jgi:hypothetical protein